MPETGPRANHILDALPAAERARLFPHMTLVDMPLGMVLYESGDELRHIYFPTDSIVSLLYVMEDGASAEIAVVGNEGIVGGRGFALHGWGNHAQSIGRAKRGSGVSHARTVAQG